MLKRLFWLRHKWGIEQLIKDGIKLGENTLIFNEAEDFGCNPQIVAIGNNCVIASGVQFLTNKSVLKYAFKENESSNNRTVENGIIIHDNCFIGINSIIYPNLVIGPNSIVGAGSVVMQDVLPNMCVSGNPSRVMCSTDIYSSMCKRTIIPNYTPRNKLEVLQVHFWSNKESSGLR